MNYSDGIQQRMQLHRKVDVVLLLTELVVHGKSVETYIKLV